MRTRTLLLLAVACGLVILAAGVVQLLRIAGQGEQVLHVLGEEVEVGDLTVVVESYEEADGIATLAVTLGGVDDADGADEFRLVAPGGQLRPVGAGDDPCKATSLAPRTCELTFDVFEVEGAGRVLLYRRGDEIARWQLDAAQRS